MVTSFATRRRQSIVISNFGAGLNTNDEPTVNSRYNLIDAQNIDFDGWRMIRQLGARWYSNEMSKQRSAGITQWYPQDYSADDKLYVSSKDAIYRCTWDGGSVPVTGSLMTFPAGFVWSPLTQFTSFTGFGNYLFAFNGINAGMQIEHGTDVMKPFGIAKPPDPTATLGTAGLPTGGLPYLYRYRYVREVSTGVREYWGPQSEYATVSPTLQKVNVGYTVPTDPQVTAIYIYRSASGGGPVFYHDRIPIASATGTYEDNIADTNTLAYHLDCLDRIIGAHWSCIFNNRLILVDDKGMISWSEVDYPQEFRSDNDTVFQTQMYGGDGNTTGCFVLGQNLYVTKERGIGVFQDDSSGNIVQVHTYESFGNVAPWAIKVCATSLGEIVPFVDGVKHLCYMPASGGPKVITEMSHQTGPFEYATTSVKDIFDNQLAKPVAEYKKYISIDVDNNIFHVFCTLRGSKFNTSRLRADIVNKRWMGIDTGLSVGPMVRRLGGKTPKSGNGELLGCFDGDSCRVVELNSGSLNLGVVAVPRSETIRLGADNDMLKEFNCLMVCAKIAKSLRVDIETYTGFLHSYYLIYGGLVVFNGIYQYDAGHRFDDTVIPLFDDGKTYDATKFGSYDYKWFTIKLPPTCKGMWARIVFTTLVNDPWSVSKVKLDYTERGEL